MLSFHVYMSMKPFHSAEWWTFIFLWLKFHFPVFLLPKTKASIYSVSVYFLYLCARFGDWKPTIYEKWRPQIRTCFWARCRNKIPHGNCDFLSTKCFINVNQSSCSTDCAAEDSKPRVMPRDQRGNQPSKNWENLHFLSNSAWVVAPMWEHLCITGRYDVKDRRAQ